MWFSNRSDTNRPVQPQKRARRLKFWIYKVEELYYPCSENKGADQLRGAPWFSHMQIVGFPMRRLIYITFNKSAKILVQRYVQTRNSANDIIN